jgi:ribosome-associated protein
MNDQNEDYEDDEWDGPSKSQLKRDAKALVGLGEKLLVVPEDQLQQIGLPDVVNAVLEAKKITKGNARKRQLQYVGKLLRNADLTEVHQLVDRFDASSTEHVTKFHQLENWRERLIEEDNQVIGEIMAVYPDVDRQQLRSLSRNAIAERKADKQPPVHFRKLFQYLKTLLDSQPSADL